MSKRFDWYYQKCWQLWNGGWVYRPLTNHKYTRFFFEADNTMRGRVRGKEDIVIEPSHFNDCKDFHEKLTKAKHLLETLERLERTRRRR